MSLEYKIKKVKMAISQSGYIEAVNELIEALEEAKAGSFYVENSRSLVFHDKPRHTLDVDGVGVVYFDPIKTD
jgi:hypothetical protein